MTVGDAFRQALDGLMRMQRRKGVDLTRATGLSSATITKLRNGERGASFDVLDKLRVAFGVEPAALFTPRYVGIAGREIDTNTERSRHTLVALGQGDIVGSPASSPTTEGDAAMHQDPVLLTALLAYWDSMAPESRLELVGHGRRLHSTGPAEGRNPKIRA